MITPAADIAAMVQRAAVAAANAQAEVAQTATKALAPRDTGALVDSIKVSPANPGRLTAQLFTKADYAVYQHESLQISHPTGQPKFMEAAVKAEWLAIQTAGAAAARAAFGK